MYKSLKISVVIPAFNEEKLILDTLSNIPEFIDSIFVIDDCSYDNTKNILEKFSKKKQNVFVYRNKNNKGVGYSIKKGYLQSIEREMDIAVVMAGDNQMDPSYLPDLLDPLINDNMDYSKGNRLSHRDRKKNAHIQKIW